MKVKLTPAVVFDVLSRAKSKLEKQLLRTNMRFSKYSIAILFLFLASCVQPKINYEFKFVEVSDALRADALGYAWVCGPPPDFKPIATMFEESSAFSISVFGDISPDAMSDPPVIIRMGTDRSNCAFYYKTSTSSRHFHFDVFQRTRPSHGTVRRFDRDQVVEFISNACTSDRPRPPELNCRFIEEPDVKPRIIVFQRSQLRMVDEGRRNLHVPRYFAFVEGALVTVN